MFHHLTNQQQTKSQSFLISTFDIFDHIKLKEGLNIKQVELAEIIEMEPSNLSKLENGNQLPKEENIEKIAKALNVEVKDLFDFGHLKSHKELQDSIIKTIKASKTVELEFIYKIINNLKQYKK